jgi:hypothetical protein
MTDLPERILVDTTILVDVLRGRTEAADFLIGSSSRQAVSSLTVAELYAGSRASDEMPLARLLSLFHVLPVSTAVAQLGGTWRRRYGPAHGVSLVDALIAATARLHDLRVATHNRKHFPMLDDVIVPY